MLGRLRECLRSARVVLELVLADLAEAHVEIGRDVRVEDLRCALGDGVGIARPTRLADAIGDPLDVGVEIPVARLFG